MNHRLRDTICKMSLKGLVAGRQAEKNMSQGKKHPFGTWAKMWNGGKGLRVMRKRGVQRQ